MENFKVGDRVVCVDVNRMDSRPKVPNLILNREYIVYGVSFCTVCRTQAIDVGLIAEITESICVNGHSCIRNDKIRWCGSYRFRKVAEKVEYIAVAVDVEIEEPNLN